MPARTEDGPRHVAIYLDFENLAISAGTVYPGHDHPLDLRAIMSFAKEKGVVCQKKAYADWSKGMFSQYQSELMGQGFELIHLPETNSQGKNGSDVRLAIDVMEYLEEFPGIDTLMIGSGDTDFIPLIQRLRARGKTVVVLGFEHSVGNLVKRNSAEFVSLETLIGPLPAASPAEEPDVAYGRDLLLEFLRRQSQTGPVLMAQLKQQMLRLDPDFSEKKLGFASFKAFVEALEGDLVTHIDRQNETLPIVHFDEALVAQQRQAANRLAEAQEFLARKLRYQSDPQLRSRMATIVSEAFTGVEARSMNELVEALFLALDEVPAKTDLKKYINTLFTGGAFAPLHDEPHGPLLSRPFCLRETAQDPADLDDRYIQRITDILQSRYPEMGSEELLGLLF